MAAPGAGACPDVRTEDARLTRRFRDADEVEGLPNMGAVEPLWEKAIEPLEQETAGERGAGVPGRLEETEMEERRLIQEGRRVGGYLVVSISDTEWLLGA